MAQAPTAYYGGSTTYNTATAQTYAAGQQAQTGYVASTTQYPQQTQQGPAYGGGYQQQYQQQPQQQQAAQQQQPQTQQAGWGGAAGGATYNAGAAAGAAAGGGAATWGAGQGPAYAAQGQQPAYNAGGYDQQQQGGYGGGGGRGFRGGGGGNWGRGNRGGWGGRGRSWGRGGFNVPQAPNGGPNWQGNPPPKGPREDGKQLSLNHNSRSIKVGRLPPRVTDDELGYTFAQFGPIASVSVKGSYGYVNFVHAESCAPAIASHMRVFLKGAPVTIKAERPKFTGPMYQMALEELKNATPAEGIDLNSLVLQTNWNEKFASMGTLPSFIASHTHIFEEVEDHPDLIRLAPPPVHVHGTPSDRKRKAEPQSGTSVGIFNLAADYNEQGLDAILAEMIGFQYKNVVTSHQGVFKGFLFCQFDNEENAATGKAALQAKANEGFFSTPVEIKYGDKPGKRVKTEDGAVTGEE